MEIFHIYKFLRVGFYSHMESSRVLRLQDESPDYFIMSRFEVKTLKTHK